MVELLIIFGSVVFIMVCVTFMVRWGIDLEREKIRAKHGTPGANSLTSSELRSLIGEAVASATDPLRERIEQLESGYLQEALHTPMLQHADGYEVAESVRDASYFASGTPAPQNRRASRNRT
jgi:hypothetical protein